MLTRPKLTSVRARSKLEPWMKLHRSVVIVDVVHGSTDRLVKTSTGNLEEKRFHSLPVQLQQG